MAKIVECVPNFSEGRNKKVIEKIVDAVRCLDGIKLLDYSSDSDHNRTVVTFLGTPEKVEKAILDMAEKVYENIDMSTHIGAHLRMGALDVVPFIPISDVSMDECVELARRVGMQIASKFEVPVYLYEKAASASYRENLAAIRKGQYEGFFEKIKDDKWSPDYGTPEVNVKGGCVAIGARVPLVAFNVNLGTDNLEIADKIARSVRNIGGGLRFVKAMGVKMEANRYGVSVVGSEVIGLLPMQALIECAQYYLQIEDFSMDQILEKRIWE